jgi:hypothetical protein
MRHLRVLFATLLATAAFAADALPEERETVDNRQVAVWPKKEVNINVKQDPDVSSRELWYRSFDGKAWGAWQKHGQAFSKEAPITWAPPEGHWQVYVRKILTSNLSMPEPTADSKVHGEFIIDRTAPQVAVKFPANKAILAGGQKYTVTWDANDRHLRSSPVTITWSRDGKSQGEVVAANIPNNGAYDWTVPKDMTTSGVLRIETTDKAGNVGGGESTGIVVDSIKPRGKVVGPAIANRQDVNLDLDIKDEGPAGLSNAQVWVSQDEGGSWTQGPVVQDYKQVGWKAPADGRYRLAIVAEDKAANKSPIPKGKSDDQFQLIIDTTAPVIQLSSAIGIQPADQANPGAKRDYKPGDRVQVPFMVKDANLAPNTVTVLFQADPSKPWQELGTKLPADAAFRFAIPEVETKQARIKVTAVDQANNVGEAIATETFAIQTQIQGDDVEIK